MIRRALGGNPFAISRSGPGCDQDEVGGETKKKPEQQRPAEGCASGLPVGDAKQLHHDEQDRVAGDCYPHGISGRHLVTTFDHNSRRNCLIRPDHATSSVQFTAGVDPLTSTSVSPPEAGAQVRILPGARICAGQSPAAEHVYACG